MTNYEEVVSLVIFVPCLFCVVVGIFSMASYRCTCCCPDGINRSRSLCPVHDRATRPFRILRLMTPQRGVGGSTTRSSTLIRHRDCEFSVRFENTTEFDIRQNLHLERGVLALESPPSYATAMDTLRHQKESRDCRLEIDLSDDRRGQQSENFPLLPMINEIESESFASNRGSPPPYEVEDDPAHVSQSASVSPSNDNSSSSFSESSDMNVSSV